VKETLRYKRLITPVPVLRPVKGSFAYTAEAWCFVKCWEVSENLSHYLLSKNDSGKWKQLHSNNNNNNNI
jgi:hypothetical protein